MSALELVVNNDATPEPEVIDIVDGVADIDAAIEALKARRMYAMAYLFETIGKPMLERGQKTKTIDGIKYHCEPPRDHLACTCHATYVYFCPNGDKPLGTKWMRFDDKPVFYISKATKDKD